MTLLGIIAAALAPVLLDGAAFLGLPTNMLEAEVVYPIRANDDMSITLGDPTTGQERTVVLAGLAWDIPTKDRLRTQLLLEGQWMVSGVCWMKAEPLVDHASGYAAVYLECSSAEGAAYGGDVGHIMLTKGGRLDEQARFARKWRYRDLTWFRSLGDFREDERRRRARVKGVPYRRKVFHEAQRLLDRASCIR